jgi:hypothetical protein
MQEDWVRVGRLGARVERVVLDDLAKARHDEHHGALHLDARRVRREFVLEGGKDFGEPGDHLVERVVMVPTRHGEVH